MSQTKWKPSAGQVALIEPVEIGEGPECLTGVVMANGDGVMIDIGASPRPASPTCEVVASFFSPDAMYRLTATARSRPAAPEVLDLTIHDVERVQRRNAPRARTSLPVTLSNFDDPGEMLSVRGETIDIAPGGCRVSTKQPFPSGLDPTVSIEMPDGQTLMLLAQILESKADAEHCEYRLVFADVEDLEREQLASLTR